MPMSEKEIIERLPDWIAEKKTSFLFGSGTSVPGMPLMGEFEKSDKSIDIGGLKNKIINRNKLLLEFNENDEETEQEVDSELKAVGSTLNTYKEFIGILLNVLSNVNSRERHKNINIFTTNYDLFIEKAVDDFYKKGSSVPFIFNDGARGYFKRFLDSSNFDTTTAYKGRFDNYINELPSINLIKIHGSVNWKKQSENVVEICNHVIDDSTEVVEVVTPDGSEQEDTTLKKHYYDMLRFFEYEMSENAGNAGNGSLLIVHGFSFGDDHIARALKRVLENRELLVVVVAYDDEALSIIKDNLKDCAKWNNLHFLSPKDFSFLGGNFSNLDFDNFNKIITGKLKRA